MQAAQPRQNTTFTLEGRRIHGYLAKPPSGRGPGVLLIQEWWGLTDHIADVAERLAAAGYVTLAPDLFGGRTTHDAEEAARMKAQLPVERAVHDLLGSADWLLARSGVEGDALGVVGFCMGGGFVLAFAAAAGGKVAAAVPFYGLDAGENPDFSGMRAAVQGHFGERDRVAPPDRAAQVAEEIRRVSGVPVELHVYPAGHAFLNDENLLGTYDPEQARLAWGRALDFLGAHLPATRSGA
jgi:carboxymethylenebutenolidase